MIASASTGEGELSYRWRFGDKEAGEGEIIEHTFTKTSEFGTLLRVTDGNGQETTYRIVINVTGSEPAEVLQLPYRIEGELADRAVSIRSGRGITLINGGGLQDAVTVYNYQEGEATYLTLFGEDLTIIATDWILPDVKENIVFSKRNTTVAEIMATYEISRWPNEYKAALYERFEQHPRFEEALILAESYDNLTGLEEDFSILTREIGIETAQTYAIEQGWIDLEKGIILPNPIEGTATPLNSP